MISLLMLAATVNSFAVSYTAKAKVTLTSQNGYTSDITIAESADLTAGTNAGYCSIINMEGRVVALYAIYNGAQYQTFGTKELGAMHFGIKTNADTDYKLTFSNVSGAKTLQLVDLEARKLINIAADGEYSFTAPANSVITDRFKLYIPGTYEICHRYGKLQITENPSTADIVIKDATGATVMTVPAEPLYQEIDLAGLAVGHYTVEANGQTLTISVQ